MWTRSGTNQWRDDFLVVAVAVLWEGMDQHVSDSYVKNEREKARALE
jgi:hypothetical protein